MRVETLFNGIIFNKKRKRNMKSHDERRYERISAEFHVNKGNK